MGQVTYRIVVTEFTDNLYRATWTCSACNEVGAWAPTSGDAGQAAALAVIGLEVHHSFMHGHPRRQPRKLRS